MALPFKPFYEARMRVDPFYVMDQDEQVRVLAALRRHGWDSALADPETLHNLLRGHCAAVREGKGLLLSGPFGVGKTCFALAYRDLLAGGAIVFDTHDARDMEMLRSALSAESSIDLRHYNVIVDDLGYETMKSDYGIYAELMSSLVGYLEAGGTPKARLVITTNLTAEEVAARYGGRDYSRLKSLVVPVPYTGVERRHWTDLSKVNLERPAS